MPRNPRQILADALELPPLERAELLECLLSSFGSQGRKAIDALWAQEAEDRADAFDCGEMPGIPAKDVFGEIVAGPTAFPMR